MNWSSYKISSLCNMTKKCKLYGWVLLFTMLAKSRNYWLHPKYIFEQAFYRLILLIQKNEKINILSVQFILLNFPPSSGAKKGSDERTFIMYCKLTSWETLMIKDLIQQSLTTMDCLSHIFFIFASFTHSILMGSSRISPCI